MKAQRGSRGVILLFVFNPGARWKWVVNAMPLLLYPQERDLYPLCEARWAPGPFWIDMENLAPTRI